MISPSFEAAWPSRMSRSTTLSRRLGSIATRDVATPSTWTPAYLNSSTVAMESRLRRVPAADGLMPPPALAGRRIRSERFPEVTDEATEALSEVAVTATAETTARPIVSAKAVAAARRGARAMLRDANRHPPPRGP